VPRSLEGARGESREGGARNARADAEKFCKGITPGGGRILSCLKSREAELQPTCAAEFKQRGNAGHPPNSGEWVCAMQSARSPR